MRLSVLMRWGSSLIALSLLLVFIYRPHSLRGETVPPPFPPQRIVSLSLAADEIVLALLPPERIAALTYLADDPHYSNVVREAQQIPYKIRADAEQVIARQPDLIITSASAYTGVTARTLLRETGIPLVELPWHDSLSGVQQNILLIGKAVGAADGARALVAEMNRRLEDVAQRVAGAPRPRVLYYFPGGFTAGRGTTMDEMITRAGGLNVAAEAKLRGVKQLSQERLMTLNPGIILIGGSDDQQHAGGLRAFLLTDPILSQLDATRTGQVYVLPLTYMGSLSHHMVKGVEAVARILHPQVFETESVAQDVLREGPRGYFD